MAGTTDIRHVFFQECEELLEALDDGLNEISLASEEGTADPETVNAVFRAVHSIKGGSAAFGLETLVRFAHQFETALDAVRSGKISIGSDAIKIFLRAADYLSNLVSCARDNLEPSVSVGQDLVEKLTALLKDPSETTPKVQPEPFVQPADQDLLAFQPLTLSLDIDARSERTYRITFHPTNQLFKNGHDPVFLFKSLSDIGPLTVDLDSTALPSLPDLDWSQAYLGWSLRVTTSEPREAIEDVFEFVEGLCKLEIVEEKSEPDVEIPAANIENSTASQEKSDQRGSPSTPSAASATSKSAGSPSAGQKGSVRVDLELVDRLINIVGELVINQAVLAQCVQDAGLPASSDVSTGLDEFRSLARELQENVMAIRAQSVKPLFQRMARIVREASDLAGKNVNFETEGEAVEVDKTVIERLVDPLTHIIRNAVDHGLENAETRRQVGKPEVGVVKLAAAHRSGRVLIEVTDDGGGINRPKVRQIAIDKGLIPADAVLSDSEIDKLLFLPGFSTAAKVTDLSGRGVGMDVVRSSIQSLGGRVSISSTPGKGTTLSISLPLTLAVLDGMVVDVAGQTMVVPITAIIETLRPALEDIHHVASAGHVVAVREKFVPIIDLAAAFGHRQTESDYSKMVLLLVESGQNERWALAVDRIFDQRQVVIKGLETNYGHVPGVAAATILGDGRIALIIDPDETAQRSRNPMQQMLIPVPEEV